MKPTVPTEPDTKKREPGCQCHLEEGDSPCRVHGDDTAAVPPEPAPPTAPAQPYERHCGSVHTNWRDGSHYCGACGGPWDALPAAPLTVAPAREREMVHEVLDKWRACDWAASQAHGRLCDEATAMLERDRASRSPGPADDTLTARQWEMIVRVIDTGGTRVKALRLALFQMLDAREVTSAAGFTLTVNAKARLYDIQQDIIRAAIAADDKAMDEPAEPSALRGEGPSPAREGKEPESPAFSGLDAATVEGPCLVCSGTGETTGKVSPPTWRPCVACGGLESDVADRLRALDARIRALATPPGQTKPVRR